MDYIKQNFEDGQVLTAEHLNHIEDGIDAAMNMEGRDGQDGAPGQDGVGVRSIQQTVTASEDGGSNVVTVTLTDGKTTTFTVKNGSKGSTGEKGDPYTLTEADKAEIVAAVIESLGGNPIFGYVDEDNNIIVQGDLADGTYSVKYEMENGNVVDIGDMVLDSNVYYSVTSTLTNCTSNNSTKTVVEGGSYAATIIAKDGYELKSVTVTMGGSPVSVSGGSISIANVTGDIVITAVAEESKPAYTNLADPTSAEWKDGVRLTSSGVEEPYDGVTLMNTIQAAKGDIVRVKGATTIICAMYKGTTFYKRCSVTATSDQWTNIIVDGDFTQFGIAYTDITSIRFYGKLSGTAEDVIITVNEEIV